MAYITNFLYKIKLYLTTEKKAKIHKNKINSNLILYKSNKLNINRKDYKYF